MSLTPGLTPQVIPKVLGEVSVTPYANYLQKVKRDWKEIVTAEIFIILNYQRLQELY